MCYGKGSENLTANYINQTLFLTSDMFFPYRAVAE